MRKLSTGSQDTMEKTHKFSKVLCIVTLCGELPRAQILQSTPLSDFM